MISCFPVMCMRADLIPASPLPQGVILRHRRAILRLRYSPSELPTREGAYLLGSNTAAVDPEILWRQYVQLTDLEEAFRVLKSELHLRPIWHRIDRRVEAHVMVAFLGYCPWVCMKQKPRRVPCSITPARALESLAGILMVEVWFTLCGGRHLCLARISGVGTGATAVTASLAAAVAGGRRRSSHHPFCRFGIDFGRIREVETTKNRQKPLKIKGKGRLRQFQWISSMGSVACQPRNRAWPTGSWSCGSLARRGRIRGREVCLKRTHQRSRSTRKWPPGNGLRSARWRRYSIAAAAGFTSSPARRKTSRLPSGSFKLGADFSYLLARTPRASITSNCKPGGTTCVG